VLLAGGRLFVADSGHNRIVIAGLDGRVQGIVGEGGAGAHDGPAGHASFHNPQGLEVIDGTLYVADTGNHMIRAVDLETRMVTTVAGTGRKGRSVIDGDPADPRRLALRSPWALASVDRYLFIAMAGSHQIWAMDTQAGRLGPWAGSGHEGHVDGPVREAAFAQPSGLAREGRLMLVADSEVSSVRAIDMTKGHVGTIVGRGLFEFGDRDGTTDEAMLQHPLDVAVDAGGIFVADSYNNKVKVLVMETGEVRTLFGDGRREVLDEPGGIAVQGSRLYIADTNNHRILKGEPATRLLGEFVLEAGRK
jgi:DNA-binding beta-propeller fold protein YncE